MCLVPRCGDFTDMLRLKLDDVEIKYDATPIVSGVTLEIAAGEFVGVIGPNGSGKTTMLRAVAKILKPSRGAVILDGRDLAHLSAKELAREIAVVPQDTTVAFDFTCLEVVLMGRNPHLGRFQIEGHHDLEIAEQSMRQTDTWHLASRPINALSGGERQRVIVARALAQQARTILLDEPTSHLDINYQFEILDLIRQLNRDSGLTVLAVLHDLNLAASYCDRLVMIGGGKIQAVGTPEEVLTAENVRRVYGAEVWVRRHPTSGRPYVISGVRGPVSDGDGFEKRHRVHVICGGGTGAPIFAALFRRGYSATAGVLNLGDTDQEAADALGLEYVKTPPFSSIPPEAIEASCRFAECADIIVVADVPIGQWNMPDLAVAELARQAGKPVALLRPDGVRSRDFTGGDGMDLYARLIELQAEPAADLQALLEIIERASAREATE